MSLILGLGAALAWAFHDIVVRRISQGTRLLPMLFMVLGFGTLILLPFALGSDGWPQMTRAAMALSVVSGALFGLASLALYGAFAIGPVRLVAPIIGAYPLLSLLLATAVGAPLTALHWLGGAIVVSGVMAVALLSGPAEASQNKTRAIVLSLIAGCGFAVTFALSQAATRAGAEVPVMFLMRSAAFSTIGAGLWLVPRAQPALPPRSIWPRLAMLGLLDTSAIGLIITAGALPHPEFAAVTSSLFGMFTVMLARFVLHEDMTARQWYAAAVVFVGIGLLGL